METVFLLIRHGHVAPIGDTIPGRSPGVHLTEQGRAQSETLASRLSHFPIRAIHSSPLERAMETARPLAERLDLPVEVSVPLLELEFGLWTGASFADLDREDERWRRYNAFRSGTRIPGGEMAVEVQSRVVGEITRLAGRHEGHWVALFSHGDVIRCALAHYLGMPLDLITRIEINPACVSQLVLSPWGARVVMMNGALGAA